ncbi:MAG: glycosyltransferase family 2 protein [Bacteroidia bacterium]|nr:glycosyltransferase family 2 protein [Bacteroidia bacterium]NNK53188.1 glycosyltransferase family 2 protein [Flavobacteriaceae bacterium]NNM09402.1 glycosyltransferase family 2 protein [Flavobacteriaceae bacterium]
MNISIVIPAHNEEAYLDKTLDSLVSQTLLPKKIIVVNDNSTDNTQQIIDSYSGKYEFIHGVSHKAGSDHVPGAKVIEAFNRGLSELDSDYDVICKFDADLVFPIDYLQKLKVTFQSSESIGMAGGFCYVEKNGSWHIEGLTGKDHIRGALKAYRKECFQQIGGLKRAMGWDTIDELLALYHGWEVRTIDALQVKHMKPTGTSYSGRSGRLQGTAFKKMRYGFLLTLIASAKLSLKKRNFSYFLDCIKGYFSGDGDFMIGKDEGRFIRKLRWRNIRKKLF